MDDRDEQIIRILRWMKGEKPGPYSIEFYTDVGCNLFCKFCDTEIKPIKHLNMNHANKILDEAKDLGVKMVRVIGVGDPFLKKEEMTRFMTRIKEYGMFGFTVTNATVLGDDEVKQLVKIGWDEIRISFHGHNEEIHDYITGKKGAFERVITNLKSFQRWKTEFKTALPLVRINHVLNKRNYSSIDNMAQLCNKLGADLVILPLEIPDFNNIKYKKDLILNKEDKQRYKKIMDKLIKKHSGSTFKVLVPQVNGEYLIDKLPKTEKELREKFTSMSYSDDIDLKNEKPREISGKYANFLKVKCFDPWLNLTINDYDKFGVCCPSVSFTMDNKKTGNKSLLSLSDIWYGPYFENMRESILNNNLKQFCSFCSNTDAVFFTNELANVLKEREDIINEHNSVIPEDIPKEQIKRLKQWMDGEKPGPYSLELYTDDGCNLECKFCGNDHVNVKHLDFEVANKILDQGHELGIRLVRILGGGDPFFKRKELMGIVKKIKSYGMFGYVVTNGTLFSEEDINTIVRIKWDELRISLHGATESTHDFITGKKGAFNLVIHNLNLFRYYKEKYDLAYPKIKINFVLNKQNFKEIEKMADLCHQFCCDLVILALEYPISSNNSFKNTFIMDKEDIKLYNSYIKEIIKKYEHSGTEISVPMINGEPLVEKCEKKNITTEFKRLSYGKSKRREVKKSLYISEHEMFLDASCYDPWLNITIRDFSQFGVCSPSVSHTMDQKTRKNQIQVVQNLRELWYGKYYSEMRKNILYKRLKDFCSFCVNTDTEFLSNELKKQLKIPIKDRTIASYESKIIRKNKIIVR